jgi:uncharacterized repeat protein (TIGR01451 family)
MDRKIEAGVAGLTHDRTRGTVIATLFATIALAACMLVGRAHAAPPANTPIGNQASATYLDATATPRTVTSNLVTTIVQQVAGFTLTADGARTAAPGGQGVFPHVLTNNGNGTDTFPLVLANLAGDDFDLTGLAIYADADGNGVPDNFTSINTTGPMIAGAQFRFVVVGNVPGTQLATEIARMRVTATSAFDNAQTAFNTDIVTVTGNAVVNVTKAINTSNGPSPSGPYTYTFTYTNSGNSVATNVVLTDLVPAGMTYVANSGRWSTTGASVLTDAGIADAQGTAPNTIVYDFGATAPNTVTAKIARVAPGASGTVTFQVNVNAGLAPQTINNFASFVYNDGVANVGPFTTNLSPFVVDASASLTFTGQTVASALQGATVSFTNVLTNTGNSGDVFDIVINPGSFPAGSSYNLYRSDGVTPLTDSNTNGIPDTGPIPAGGSYNVILKVTLAANATGGAYSVTKTATSANNPSQTATATDVLTTIVANSVDVTNTSPLPGAPGAGSGPEAAAVVSLNANPASTVRFTLYVNNTSTVADNYDLQGSTDLTFGALTLPAGWSATFRDGANAIITNTGNIAAGGSKLVNVDVDVPAGYVAGAVALYFRAVSPVSGANDRIHDAVSVNVVRGFTLVPNNSAQVAPGGSVMYTHLLVNNGNVVEGDGVGSFVAVSAANDQAGWSSALYYDANGSGVFDAGDGPLSDLTFVGGLAPGQTLRVFQQVFSPAGAPLGQVNTSTITVATSNLAYASPAPANVLATDVTTVINGQLQLVKRQALDGTCDGVADGAYGVLNITTGAVPGACVRYEITVTNVGTSPVTNVVVSDATPSNTVFSSAGGATTSQGSIVTPLNGAAGSITATIGTLAPGQSAVVVFGIRINP